MPRRTNDFQGIVYLVKRCLAEEGQTVEESGELEDSATGRMREVDVVLRTQVSGHDLVISIECRDHKRPASVQWVEEMSAKHQHLPTHLLVLVASNGFTEAARKKAKHLGIDLLTFNQAPAEVENRVKTRLRSIRGRRVQLLPLSVSITFRVNDLEVPTDLIPSVWICLPDGTHYMIALELVVRILRDEKYVREAFIAARPGASTATFFAKNLSTQVAGEEVPLCIMFVGRPYPISQLEIKCALVTAETTVELARAMLGEAELDWAKAEIGGEKALLVFTKDPAGHDVGFVRFKDRDIPVAPPARKG